MSFLEPFVAQGIRPFFPQTSQRFPDVPVGILLGDVSFSGVYLKIDPRIYCGATR